MKRKNRVTNEEENGKKHVDPKSTWGLMVPAGLIPGRQVQNSTDKIWSSIHGSSDFSADIGAI